MDSTKRYGFRLNRIRDVELIKALDSAPNLSAFIRDALVIFIKGPTDYRAQVREEVVAELLQEFDKQLNTIRVGTHAGLMASTEDRMVVAPLASDRDGIVVADEPSISEPVQLTPVAEQQAPQDSKEKALEMLKRTAFAMLGKQRQPQSPSLPQ